MLFGQRAGSRRAVSCPSPVFLDAPAPSNWTYAQRYAYLWTELIPVLVFIAIGVGFWWLGRRTRAQAAAPPR
jgi:hypothetical protein